MINLNTEFELLGVNAPALIWGGASVLFVGTAWCLLTLWRHVLSERRQHRELTGKIEQIRIEFPRHGKQGLALAAFNALEKLFEGIVAWRAAWNGYNAHVLIEAADSGEDQVWSAESAEVAFTDAAVIDSRLNRSLYAAVPSLVTSLGLLLTFVAILLALLDVRVEKNQVQGLEGLVAGLSGKFISSVVALLSASFFLFCERRLLHSLGESRHALVAAIDHLVPRRTQLQVVSGLREDMRQMSDAFRHFNGDLSGRMKQSFSESVGPNLDRMVKTIEELTQLLRAADAQKQESITGSLESLLRNLEDSIRTSLGKMGEQFSESLAGGATEHFEEVTRTLSATAKLLQDMNTQSQGTQAGLTDLVNFARNSTAEQMALGKTQVEDLSRVLRALMGQLQETTGSSLAGMTAALTGVVHDLSNKVTDLTERTAATMTESSGQATAAATTVVEQARTWSEHNASQLSELSTDLVNFARNSTAEQMALGKTQVEELSQVLRALMGQLQETTGTSLSGMTAALTGVVHDLSNKVTDLTERTAATMTESSGQATAAASTVVEQARTWSESNAAQLTELLKRHESHVGRIEDLRKLLETTLGQFRQGMQEYGGATTELRKTAGDVGLIVARAADTAESMRQIQSSLQTVASVSAGQVEQLAQANRQQEEAWRRIDQSMQQYESMFGRVDQAAGTLLKQISENLREYTATSHKSFDDLVSVSNDHMGNAVQKLSGAISELEEYLSDLTETLAKFRPKA